MTKDGPLLPLDPRWEPYTLLRGRFPADTNEQRARLFELARRMTEQEPEIDLEEALSFLAGGVLLYCPPEPLTFTLALSPGDADPAEELEATSQPGISKVHVLPLGDVETIDGRMIRTTLPDLMELSSVNRKNKLPVLAEHGKSARWGGEALGWVKSLEVNPSGLWALTRWLPETAQAIREERWRYISPSFIPKKPAPGDGGFKRPARLVEVSLTNTPAIDGMEPVSLPD